MEVSEGRGERGRYCIVQSSLFLKVTKTNQETKKNLKSECGTVV